MADGTEFSPEDVPDDSAFALAPEEAGEILHAYDERLQALEAMHKKLREALDREVVERASQTLALADRIERLERLLGQADDAT